ncbi:hypothetical protein JVT61DRAFT_12041 [Boletus reticuloceps]|uniref:Uncharacterized protein n=1 Tax=Boletus reticuloceps TaxID=495285 RepID=A0A8I2YEH3_9AGAM|nr:hypothetical protein JVT61DRAFT_12041 [Boletus reticuloceps]
MTAAHFVPLANQYPDELHHLVEVEDGYRCPLCEFVGLPNEMHQHVYVHYSFKEPGRDGQVGAIGGVEPPEQGSPPHKRPRLAHSEIASQPTEAASSQWSSSSLHPLRNATMTPSFQSTVQFSLPTPCTPSPYRSQTLLSSLTINHHNHATSLIKSAITANFELQQQEVGKFLNSHIGTCMLHTVFKAPMPAAHYDLRSCDLFVSYDSEDFHTFRTAFWTTKNTVRCISCGFPGLPDVTHKFLPNTCKCQDWGLQDWILILCYYI